MIQWAFNILFRPNSKRVGIQKSFSRLLIALALVGIASTLLPTPQVDAAIVCPETRSGSLSASEVVSNPNAIREEDTIEKTCSDTGIFAQIRCALARLFANLSSPENNPGKLNLQDSQMPGYLRAANELALSGELEERDEPGGITGGIAKVLPPGYRQDDLDPIKELEESEGQLVTGKITLNNQNLQRTFTDTVYEEASRDAEKGYYDLQVETEEESASDYQVEGRFGEISPLYDRYGFLRQALTPPAGEAEIPDEDCIEYDPSVIAVTEFEQADPNRDVPWTAFQYVGDKPEAKPKTLDCDVNEEEGTRDCPNPGEENFEVGGNLDIQSEVSLAGEAWERIGAPSTSPGQGGVFNVLLPPDAHFRTEQAETRLNFSYDTHSNLENYSNASKLNIADLGNVRGAVECIVRGLTSHPALANPNACESAFGSFAGIPIECTDEATPLPFENTAGSSIARRAWNIVNNMYQGFWCYWNWSKDDYPQYFDEEEYRVNPNPSYPPDKFIDLFWCTRLVNTTHNRSYSLNTDEMARQFGAAGPQGGPYNSGGRFISAKDATWENIRPGYAVFFRVLGSPTSHRLNHVGIVYSVSQDAVVVVHSNAATKSITLTVGSDGKIQDFSNFRVEGFGRP